MWDAIAYRLWGRETLMHYLMQANPQHRHIVIFSAGVDLIVPALDIAKMQPAATPPWQK